MQTFILSGVVVQDIHVTIPKNEVLTADPLLHKLIFQDAGIKFTSQSERQYQGFFAALQEFDSEVAWGGSNANVAINLAEIFGGQARVYLWTPVPPGELGEKLIADFKARNVHIINAYDGDTAGKIACNLIATVEGASDRSIIKPPQGRALNFSPDTFPHELYAPGAAVVLQGSTLQRTPEVFYRVRSARTRKNPLYFAAPTDVRLTPRDREICAEIIRHEADLFASNREELAALLGRAELGETKQIAAMLRSVDRETCGRRQLTLVTNGANGAELFVRTHRIAEYQGYNVQARNPVGSGDMAFSALIAGIELGLDPVACGRLAGIWGALNAEKVTKSATMENPLAALAAAKGRFGADEDAIIDGVLTALTAPDHRRRKGELRNAAGLA